MLVRFFYSIVAVILLATLSAFAIEEATSDANTRSTGIVMLERQIADLHDRIYFMIREQKKKPNKEKTDNFRRLNIRLDVGLNNRITSSEKSTFEEHAVVELDGDVIKKVEFRYERTGVDTLTIEKRTITNGNVKAKEAGHIRVVTVLALDEKDFTISELETNRLKTEFLTLYRDYLERLHKHLLLEQRRRSEANRVRMQKILKFDRL